MNLKSVLKEKFGFDSFRELQEETINSVLNREDTLLILKTSGGKSLCYQFPATVMDGIVIVISPLISLMKDQVDGMKKKGLNACYFSSGMDTYTMQVQYSKMVRGYYDIAYIAPERLAGATFQYYFKQMNVSLLVVDEAHCISQWGHGFRPDYQRVKNYRDYYERIRDERLPILAVTATAGNYVKKDILTGLQLRNPNIYENKSYRNNLRIYVEETNDKIEWIKKFLMGREDQCGIIYVRRTKKAERIAQRIGASYYHGQLQSYLKNKNQSDWISGKTNVIVATHAFGMGIDKDNVRFVIHIDLPESIEAYTQEIGRGGRDGKMSDCIYLARTNEFTTRQMNYSSYPSAQRIEWIYRYIFDNYSDGDIVDLFNMAVDMGVRVSQVQSTLNLFQAENIIHLRSKYRPSHVVIIKGRDDFDLWIGKDDIRAAIVFYLFKSCKGVVGAERVFKKDVLQKATNEPIDNYVSDLENKGFIKVYPESTLSSIYFKDDYKKDFKLVKEVSDFRRFFESYSFSALIDFLKNNKECRHKVLGEYFDSEHKNNCGVCDVCTGEIFFK